MRNVIIKGLPQAKGYKPVSVNRTLQPVPRDEANVEAEAGETVVTSLNFDGLPEHYTIGGKRHSEGGTPLNLPEQSFIFSDTRGMRIKDENLLKFFGKKNGGSYTPAELAKKYDINKYKKILADPYSDKIQRDTAEKMIVNYNDKLAQLALAQESMKGFPDGLPFISIPYLESVGIDPVQIMPDVEQVVEQNGQGLEMAQDGLNKTNNFFKSKGLYEKYPDIADILDKYKASGNNPDGHNLLEADRLKKFMSAYGIEKPGALEQMFGAREDGRVLNLLQEDLRRSGMQAVQNKFNAYRVQQLNQTKSKEKELSQNVLNKSSKHLSDLENRYNTALKNKDYTTATTLRTNLEGLKKLQTETLVDPYKNIGVDDFGSRYNPKHNPESFIPDTKKLNDYLAGLELLNNDKIDTSKAELTTEKTKTSTSFVTPQKYSINMAPNKTINVSLSYLDALDDNAYQEKADWLNAMMSQGYKINELQ